MSFGYTSQNTLINHLNLSIPAASKVAIVGPTGAGKSTLINLLMRFYKVNSGAIYLDGVSMADYSVSELRQQIGMVLQETWLKVGTIHDNIAYGNPDATREEVVAAAKQPMLISLFVSYQMVTILIWLMQEHHCRKDNVSC